MSTLKKRYFLILASVFLMACERHEIIVEGLSQNDANEILVVLKDQDITAQKELVSDRKHQSYHIKVGKADIDRALRVLVNNQLPKSYRAGFKDVYPPGSQGLIPTKSDENARLIMAMQGEIEGLLRILPGVVDARVMLFIDSGPSPRSASVALIYQGNLKEELISTEEIKHLVAAAAGAMSPENIHVVLKEFIIKEFKSPPPTSTVNSSQQLVWGLIIATILALLIAAYTFIRPYLNAKLTNKSEVS